MGAGPALSEEHGRMKTMQRQRGELVPIGDALSGLDDVLVPENRQSTIRIEDVHL